MRVYDVRTRGGIHTLTVAPAAEDQSAGVEEWWEMRNGERVPANLTVRFINGAAEVPDNLGRFLVAKSYARKTRPLIAA